MDAKTSYRDITANFIPSNDLPNDQIMDSTDQDLESSEIDSDLITILIQKQNRIYSPWKFSIIIKVFGGKPIHNNLKTKLDTLWNLFEPFCLIDLAYGFYTAKLKGKESQDIVLQGGP